MVVSECLFLFLDPRSEILDRRATPILEVACGKPYRFLVSVILNYLAYVYLNLIGSGAGSYLNWHDCSFPRFGFYFLTAARITADRDRG